MLFALAQLTMIVSHHDLSYYRYRGTGRQKKYWLPRPEKILLLALFFIE
jgi:hypothetical protein